MSSPAAPARTPPTTRLHFRRRPRPAGWTLLLLACLPGTGCVSFDRQWERAQRESTHPRDLAGAWYGSWQNTNNSHGGPLRAVLTPVDDSTVQARFHARWGGYEGSFRSTLTGGWEDDTFVFQSRRRIAFVLISTDGFARADRFEATYHSRPDTGTFLLFRPWATTPSAVITNSQVEPSLPSLP